MCFRKRHSLHFQNVTPFITTSTSFLLSFPVCSSMKSRQHKHNMAESDEKEFSNLPEEIWLHTIGYLTAIQDVLNLGCTCRRLYYLTNQNVLWRRRFKGESSHLSHLPQSSAYVHHVIASKDESENVDVEQRFWKKLYLKASHALSFQNRNFNGFSSIAGERLCAEFVANPSAGRNVMINFNGVRFDDRTPTKQSVEIWVKLNKKKPDGVIIGCQSESVRYFLHPS